MSSAGVVTVTVVITDLVGSTQLESRVGPIIADELREEHFSLLREAASETGGREVKNTGDGLMVAFDSAAAAVSCAVSIQQRFERRNRSAAEKLLIKAGLSAGDASSADGDVFGMPVIEAARLCDQCSPGQILAKEIVSHLAAGRGHVFNPVGALELKGLPEPVGTVEVDWEPLAAEAIALPGLPLPRMLAAFAGEPLIGREREVGLLREATAPRPGHRAALILGEPGIGKTRHAAAAASDAHAQGAVVALARCPPQASIAFEPWVRAIGELGHAGDDVWRSGLARAAGPELAALVPELSEYAGASEAPGAGEIAAAEGARYRLFRGICAALGYAAEDAPLLVVLDDAHWCDAASAQALAHLLESTPAEQLVLIVTAREREMGRRHPVSRVLSELRRTSDLTELRLEGLDSGGLAALVAARVGRAITPRLAARLRARTAGNPFFASELALDLDERGALREGEALDAIPVPDAVTDLVEERLARLDPVTERLLVAVAAIGPQAPVALAARAAGIGEEDSRRAVTQALSERLVDEVAAARATVCFPHALIREALTAGRDEASRARLHLAIAEALEEEEEAEPAELARHYGLAVAVGGSERAIAAHEKAADAAADGHDHEQAGAQLHSALALISESDLAARAPLLLELGEQRLLAADLPGAREAFRAAGEAARSIGDTHTLAHAALGFAGGDIAFGWETGVEDPVTVAFLREGLDALGDDEPRLALRMTLRLCWALLYTDDDEALPALVRRAEELDGRLGDAESRLFARYTAVVADAARGPDPLRVLDRWPQQTPEAIELAERCGREDLLFRLVQFHVTARYALGQMDECDQTIEQVAEIAERLGSPRFSWEVDADRASRLIDHGDRAGAEALLHRAGATLRRLRPDIHMVVELLALLQIRWIYDGETATARQAAEVLTETTAAGIRSAYQTMYAALEGDHETARRRLASTHAQGFEELRRVDAHVPVGLCMLALAATLSGDRAAGERLRPHFEPLRPYVMAVVPGIYFGHIAEWHVGRLEMLAGSHDAAVGELRAAVARADSLRLVWLGAWARIDLALALHRRGDHEEAQAMLAEGEQIAELHAIRWVLGQAALARAELEGSPAPAPAPAKEHVRPVRAMAARSGRRALAAMVRGQDDEKLERRFSEPRRQRALLRAAARSFQPAHSGGFDGVIAYELEPFAIEPPPEAPWRWAVEVDSVRGRARLLEPAPLQAAVTIHAGLAEWVRVFAGVQNAITAMVVGRFNVEGDVIVASRIEAMFGGA